MEQWETSWFSSQHSQTRSKTWRPKFPRKGSISWWALHWTMWFLLESFRNFWHGTKKQWSTAVRSFSGLDQQNWNPSYRDLTWGSRSHRKRNHREIELMENFSVGHSHSGFQFRLQNSYVLGVRVNQKQKSPHWIKVISL